MTQSHAFDGRKIFYFIFVLTFIFRDDFYYVFLLNVPMANVVEENRTTIRSKLILNQVCPEVE